MAKRRRKTRRSRRQSLASLSLPAPVQVIGPRSGGTLSPPGGNGRHGSLIVKILALALVGGAGFWAYKKFLRK